MVSDDLNELKTNEKVRNNKKWVSYKHNYLLIILLFVTLHQHWIVQVFVLTRQASWLMKLCFLCLVRSVSLHPSKSAVLLARFWFLLVALHLQKSIVPFSCSIASLKWLPLLETRICLQCWYRWGQSQGHCELLWKYQIHLQRPLRPRLGSDWVGGQHATIWARPSV